MRTMLRPHGLLSTFLLALVVASSAPALRAARADEGDSPDDSAAAPDGDGDAAADDMSAGMAAGASADGASADVTVGAGSSARRPHGIQLELGVFGGIFVPNKEHEFYDPNISMQQPLESVNPDVGVRLGFYPLPFLGVEGEGGTVLANTKSGGNAVQLYSLRASLVAQLPARVTPFILGGVGETWTRSDALGDDSDRVWHLGVGAKLFATPHLQVRLDGRLYRSNRLRAGTSDNGMINHWGVTAGVAWVLGGGGAPAPVANPDPDGDGFVGAEDKCPEDKGVAPDGCPVRDSDADGIADNQDKCPTEAETVNGFQDTDGCPDQVPDPDGDGIRGEADKCPDQAEDKDGFEDDDGCPDVDNDKDGVLDTADHCATDAGPVENNGCPDTDKDGDGVVDRLDNCPDEPGTKENHGCKKKQLVVLTQTQLKILDKVYFRSGKARLQHRSNRLLDNIASVLKAHPEIKKVEVQGHTDSRGPDAFNKELSQKRADAVVQYLINRGVDNDRLTSMGYGEEKPIADNGTAAGRAANRRVEFNIVEPAVQPASGGDATTPSPEAPAAAGDQGTTDDKATAPASGTSK